jgi:hypothetical protein
VRASKLCEDLILAILFGAVFTLRKLEIFVFGVCIVLLRKLKLMCWKCFKTIKQKSFVFVTITKLIVLAGGRVKGQSGRLQKMVEVLMYVEGTCEKTDFCEC